jgi:hypothetical protein
MASTTLDPASDPRWDAGFYRRASIGGGSGRISMPMVCRTQEPGLGGVTVRLFDGVAPR